MNASDIVKAKQNKVLYNSYYKPIVYDSTIYSTLRIISSVLCDEPLEPCISYTSCITTVYNYVDNPTFMSYETLNQIKAGGVACGASNASQLQFDRVPDIPMYTYSTIYSTFTENNFVYVSSIVIASTFISATPSPLVDSFIRFKQGTTQCITNQCHNCEVNL